jgi:hypothetical protein
MPLSPKDFRYSCFLSQPSALFTTSGLSLLFLLISACGGLVNGDGSGKDQAIDGYGGHLETNGTAGTVNQAGYGGTAGSDSMNGHAGYGGDIVGEGGGPQSGTGGGVVGTDGAGPECTPPVEADCTCDNGTLGTHQCQTDGTWTACYCPSPVDAILDFIKQSMTGHWQGIVTTPWKQPYSVDIIFEANGHYSAHCLNPSDGCETAFYWGKDYESPAKKYSIYDVDANGNGLGKLTVMFLGGNTQTGSLDKIFISESKDHLTFDFYSDWKDSVYGPVHFELDRTPLSFLMLVEKAPVCTNFGCFFSISQLSGRSSWPFVWMANRVSSRE